MLQTLATMCEYCTVSHLFGVAICMVFLVIHEKCRVIVDGIVHFFPYW